MERLESVTASEPSHGSRLENVAEENCSPTKSSANGQGGNKSTMNPDRLQDATRPLANKVSGEKCSSDRSDVELPQRVSRQTSELVFTSLQSDFDGGSKTSRPGVSGLESDTKRRPITYNFAGTRHESYGNLGIAGLAGLSSTSATLALLPLQASGQSRTTTTLPSPPVSTCSVVTSTAAPASVVSSSRTTSADVSAVEYSAKPAGATAASVKDRRSTFFSEPPKPISLPTRSATQLSSLSDDSFDSGLQLPTSVSSPGSKESNGPSLSVTSVPRSASGSFNVLSTAPVLESQSSLLSSLSYQHERSSLTTESSLLCSDVLRTVSAQSDVSPPMQFSDQSTTSMSDSEDANFSVWCGPPPDVAAASESAAALDKCIYEMGRFFIFTYCIFQYGNNMTGS